jgi:hypothetical protein
MTQNSPHHRPVNTGPRFDVMGGSGSTVITDARKSTSTEMSTRIRRYTITMAFRTACFLAMIVVHGNLRWVLFGAAVLLPYVAVVLANQANQRSVARPGGSVEPTDAPQLTTGEYEVISGDLADENRDEQDADTQTRHDRVA